MKSKLLSVLMVLLVIPIVSAIDTEECLGEVREDVRFTDDVYMGKGRYCFLIKEQKDITIDCNGHSIINERKKKAKRAVWAVESEGIRVIDCDIIGFDKGINFNNCKDCEITGSLEGNNIGAHLFRESVNNVITISAKNNTRNVYLEGSSDNAEITIIDEEQKIQIISSENTTIIVPSEKLKDIRNGSTNHTIYVDTISSNSTVLTERDYIGFKIYMIILIILILSVFMVFLFYYKRHYLKDDSQKGDSDEFERDLP